VSRVRLSHPDKVLWPAVGATKADLCAYLEAVADRMLPWIRRRPLTMRQYPGGVDAAGFFRKDLPGSAPAWLPRHEQFSPSSDRSVAYPMAADVDDLRWFANQNAVELHAATVHADRDDRPDLLVFALDPAEDGTGPSAAVAARWLHEILDALGLPSLVKTSGKRGLHLFVPIERRYGHDVTRPLGLAISRLCADAHPGQLTVAMRKADRGGRLLLDWSRNGAAQTMVAAWSPRPTPAATVSMPLSWEQVTDDLDPGHFTIATAPELADAWSEPPRPQRLEHAIEAVVAAGYELVDASPRSRVR
jgi:bifunctional non-homologous end joining protein LigD